MMQVKEIWKDIPNYEGMYQISSLGRVKSLAKKWVLGRNSIRYKPDTILKPSTDGSGYEKVSLCKDSKVKYFKVHRLVAMIFLEHKLQERNLVVDHINNDRTDNRLSNLQFITQRKNVSKDQFRFNRSSKYVGVTWDKRQRKWVSRIRIRDKRKYLGSFTDEFEAHLSYEKALKELSKQTSKQYL